MSMVQWWTSRWLVSAALVGLGAVILGAEANQGDLASGLTWFAIIVAVAALPALGGRFASTRDALGDAGDERDESINQRAMATAGTVLVIVLTGAIVFELVRGNDPTSYIWPTAVGGATYAIALLVLRRRS